MPVGRRGGRAPGKGKAARNPKYEDENEDDLEQDDDILGQDNNNMPGNDQEELTPEERDQMFFKQLTSANPQAPHNHTKFSWKERQFKKEDIVD